MPSMYSKSKSVVLTVNECYLLMEYHTSSLLVHGRHGAMNFPYKEGSGLWGLV